MSVCLVQRYCMVVQVSFWLNMFFCVTVCGKVRAGGDGQGEATLKARHTLLSPRSVGFCLRKF